MFISIIIPIYNENDILEKNIFDIHKYFQNKNNFEIIVIDDGSADDTLKTLRALKLNNLIILRNNQNIGKGYSIIKGVLKSKGDLILQTDADLSAPITEFEKLFQEVDNFSWHNMYDKNRRAVWWVFPGRIGQDQPRGYGTFEDVLVPDDTRTSQVHVTAIMRFIRQSGRILEDKYVTEEIVAK